MAATCHSHTPAARATGGGAHRRVVVHRPGSRFPILWNGSCRRLQTTNTFGRPLPAMSRCNRRSHGSPALGPRSSGQAHFQRGRPCATHTSSRRIQLADQLAVAVYKHIAGMPSDECFGLTMQIRRAAVSIVSNHRRRLLTQLRVRLLALPGHDARFCVRTRVPALAGIPSRLPWPPGRRSRRSDLQDAQRPYPGAAEGLTWSLGFGACSPAPSLIPAWPAQAFALEPLATAKPRALAERAPGKELDSRKPFL